MHEAGSRDSSCQTGAGRLQPGEEDQRQVAVMARSRELTLSPAADLGPGPPSPERAWASIRVPFLQAGLPKLAEHPSLCGEDLSWACLTLQTSAPRLHFLGVKTLLPWTERLTNLWTNQSKGEAAGQLARKSNARVLLLQTLISPSGHLTSTPSLEHDYSRNIERRQVKTNHPQPLQRDKHSYHFL